MAKNKWMLRLAEHDAARQWDYNPFADVLRFSSPGLNFLFGNTHGLPRGYPMIMFGPQHSGKTVLVYDLIAEMHRQDPEGLAIRFDTEYRDGAQLTKAKAEVYGIDVDRYMPYLTNEPTEIFDFIETKVKAMLDAGAPIKLLIIDSITNVLGRRTVQQLENGKSGVVIGDASKTQQDGLQRIQGLLHRYKVALVLTAQVRAEMDEWEKKKTGVDYKMAGGWYLRHLGGYVMRIEPNTTKDGRTDMAGNVMERADLTDAVGNAERTGHKIRARMIGNSYGPKGRTAEITFDYNQGIINRHEEVFTLGIKRGVIKRPKQQTYVMPNFPKEGEDMSWNGGKNLLQAVKDNEQLYQAIVLELRGRDADLMEHGAQSSYFLPEETKQPELDGE